MDTIPMPGGGTMSMAWLPMCGQSWLGAAASFLGMWTVMMAAMMLPSLVPALWRYRRSAANAGETQATLLTALAGGGYLLVWTLLGAAVFPLGAVAAAVTMRHAALARSVPVLTPLVVLAAGALQLTRWKARHLACCRRSCCRESIGHGGLPARSLAACRDGLRLGLHCARCCAGLTAVLLVTGIMDVSAMAALTGAITLERLAPAGERVARFIGMLMIGAALLLVLGAGRLG